MTWWNAQNSFLLIEMLLIVVSISLLAYGYPDATRGALWEEGGIQGFNSNPQLRVYFYANYLDPPEIPFIWSRRCTDFNLAVAILTFWVFLTRSSLRIVGVLDLSTELYLHFFVFCSWAMSCTAQQSPDYSDAENPSRVPWYLTHGCNISSAKNRTACHVAQASFGITVVFICIYAARIANVIMYALVNYRIRKYRSMKTSQRFQASYTDTCDEYGSDCGISDDGNPLMRAWDKT